MKFNKLCIYAARKRRPRENHESEFIRGGHLGVPCVLNELAQRAREVPEKKQKYEDYCIIIFAICELRR